MSGARWTEAEDAALRRLYPGRGAASDAVRDALPGRSERAISQRACQLGVSAGVRGPNSWTPDEERVAVAHLAAVCRKTGRSPVAVCHHLEWLVRKSKARGRGGMRRDSESLGVKDA